MKLALKLTLPLLSLLCAATLPLSAGVIVSTFDTDAQGWTNGDFTVITTAPGSVTHSATGGNPGGHISVGDSYAWNAFVAPAAYLGDRLSSYGQTLSMDMNYNVLGDPWPFVMISDGTTKLYSPRASAPATTWQTYTVTFLASAGWTTDELSVNPATEQQMRTVLSNLSYLAIDADFVGGGETAYLDNVAMNFADTPEPSTWLLIAGALPVLWQLRRRN